MNVHCFVHDRTIGYYPVLSKFCYAIGGVWLAGVTFSLICTLCTSHCLVGQGRPERIWTASLISVMSFHAISSSSICWVPSLTRCRNSFSSC